MRKLALFDFDGTLVNSVDDVVTCFDEALTMYDFPILTRDEYIECLGGNIDEAVSLILKDKNTPENIELIKNTYEKLYDELEKDNTKPYPEIHELLKSLQEMDMLFAINSNRKTDSIKYYVEKFFPDIHFESIEGHNPDYPSKPNPYSVNKIMKKLNICEDELIYIGDSQTDIQTAKNAKIDCLIVKWGYGNQKDYENDYVLGVVDSPSQILEYFQ